MASTTRTAILAELAALVEAAPFAFTAAAEPFGFDLQPDTHLDATYCLLAESDRVDGYLGYAQAQIDRVTLRLARKTQRAGLDTVAQLTVDITSLRGAIARAGLTSGTYSADVEDDRIEPPAADDNFVVAEITCTIDYDFAL